MSAFAKSDGGIGAREVILGNLSTLSTARLKLGFFFSVISPV